jgi:hypothetical protein
VAIPELRIAAKQDNILSDGMILRAVGSGKDASPIFDGDNKWRRPRDLSQREGQRMCLAS